MTVRDFVALRRSRRLALKADKAMRDAYGGAWERNAVGIVELLTAPGTPLVVDAAALADAIGAAVDARMGNVAEQEPPAPTSEPGYPSGLFPEAADAITVAVEPEAAAPIAVEQPSMFAERRPSNGETPPVTAPVPLISGDEKRREFVRNFLAQQRAAHGLATTPS